MKKLDRLKEVSALARAILLLLLTSVFGIIASVFANKSSLYAFDFIICAASVVILILAVLINIRILSNTFKEIGDCDG